MSKRKVVFFFLSQDWFTIYKACVPSFEACQYGGVGAGGAGCGDGGLEAGQAGGGGAKKADDQLCCRRRNTSTTIEHQPLTPRQINITPSASEETDPASSKDIPAKVLAQTFF